MSSASHAWVAALSLVLAAAPCAAAGKPPEGRTVALPDTGVFAPVAAQLRGRLARLATPPGDTLATPERLDLLLETGQPDEALRHAHASTAKDPATVMAKARLALAIQDFVTAKSLVESIGARDQPEARTLRYR